MVFNKSKIIKLNYPYVSTRKNKKMMVFVRNPKTGRLNTIHFGDTKYRQNYSKMAWEKYRKRSAGIRNKQGRLTKDNPLSANYWARKILWSGSKWRKK